MYLGKLCSIVPKAILIEVNGPKKIEFLILFLKSYQIKVSINLKKIRVPFKSDGRFCATQKRKTFETFFGCGCVALFDRTPTRSLCLVININCG